MKMQQVREKAKQWEIKTAKMKKTDLVRQIQRKEGYTQCYRTGVTDCAYTTDCCFADDCAQATT